MGYFLLLECLPVQQFKCIMKFVVHLLASDFYSAVFGGLVQLIFQSQWL
ncbi:hypothetical protein RINTHM_12430 [Richelia intracellularis HM01]|nr:hypothetical protein RINTHM_12430 [Richelia intracellularis HM01]